MNAWWCFIHPSRAAKAIISLSHRNRGLEQNNRERERQNEQLKFIIRQHETVMAILEKLEKCR